MSHIDFEALRAVPLDRLLVESGADERAVERGRFECPWHPGHKHATYYKQSNCVRCWAEDVSHSPLDFYMEWKGLSRDDAAIELHERFHIPFKDAQRMPTPAKEPSRESAAWARLRLAGLQKAGAEWLTGRGLPARYVAELGRKGLVASCEKWPVHVAGDPPAAHEYRETVAFPLWRLTCRSEWEGFRRIEEPTALWHRFLAPADRDGKLQKDRNFGSTGAAVFSACTPAELAAAHTVYVCEGVIKGLAVDVAMRGADHAEKIEELKSKGLTDAAAVNELDRQRVHWHDVQKHWRGVAWLAVTGTGGARHLPAVLSAIFGDRRKMPAVRIAFDRDAEDAHSAGAGQTAARKLYRELVPLGFDAAITLPAARKDWDDVLRLDGADALRSQLRDDVGEMVLRPGGRQVGPYTFKPKGWELWAEALNTNREGDTSTRTVLVADFTIKLVRKFVLHDWSGQKPGTELFEVTASTRQSGQKRAFFTFESYHNADKWKTLGAVHNEAAFRFYTSNAKETCEQTEEVVPIVGLVRVPGAKERYTLRGGPEVAQFNKAYTFPINNPYEHADWTGEWGGTPDPHEAIAHGRAVLQAFRGMFRRSIGGLVVYWLAGNLLKIFTRSYPHLQIVAQRGSGKSTMLKLLADTFGLVQPGLDTWATPFRMLGVLSNHALPVLVDEVSRIDKVRRAELLAKLNLAFDSGQSTLPYGQSQYPLCFAASVMTVGQDTMSDPALESKQLSVTLNEDDKSAMPKGIPRWPWRLWGQHLCDAMSRDAAAAGLNTAKELIEPHLPADLASRDRFRDCWARVFFVRAELLRFLGLDDDAGELQNLLRLMTSNAAAANEAGMEALAILQAYATIVLTEPGMHAVTIREKHDAFNRDEAGAWIVPKIVIETLRQRGRGFALENAPQFVRALRSEGMFGAPMDTDDPNWVGGFWKRRGDKWEPGRRPIVHQIRGVAVKQFSYLIPAAVLDRFQIEFPLG